MAKIDLQELVSLMDAGKSQKEAAAYFHVSPSAICQTMKRLRASTLPESVERLTDKQRAFVLAKVGGMTNAEAVKSSYDVSTTASAKALGTQLMADPHIQAAWSDLLHAVGVGRWRRAERLRDIIEAKDLGLVVKGIDLAGRMTGDFVPIKIDAIVDVREYQVRLEDLTRKLGLVEAEVIEAEEDDEEN